MFLSVCLPLYHCKYDLCFAIYTYSEINWDKFLLTDVLILLLCYSEETSKRRFPRNKYFKDVEKALHVPIQCRNFNFRISTLQVVLVIILLGSFLTLFRSPAVHIADHPSNSASRYVRLSIHNVFHLFFLLLLLSCFFWYE